MTIKNPKKYLIFASGDGYLDFNLNPVHKKQSHIDVAVIGFKDIKTKVIDYAKNADNEIYENTYNDINDHIIDNLYYQALQDGFLDHNQQFLLTYNQIKPNQYEIFALHSTLSNAQILIPAIFLPLALDPESKVEGIFLFEDWLCFYQNANLIYHSLCQDSNTLQKSLTFLQTLYGINTDVVYYCGGWLEDFVNQDNNEADISNITFLPIKQSIARLSLDFTLLCLENKALLQPFYNETTKSIYHTKSFWGGLKIAGICALIAFLPLIKLIYANHISTKATQIKAQNQALQTTLSSQKAKLEQIPAQITQLEDKITHLYNIHSRYIPRLQIISTISEIVSKNTAWITSFELTSTLEKGEVLISLNMHSQAEENLKKAIFDLKNLSHFHITQETFANNENIFNANLTIKILYA